MIQRSWHQKEIVMVPCRYNHEIASLIYRVPYFKGKIGWTVPKNMLEIREERMHLIFVMCSSL
jgi:hypothetical protein